MPGENGELVIQELQAFVDTELLPDMKAVSADADIRIIVESPVPPLDDQNAEAAATFVTEVTGLNSQGVVSFGTDAGYFSDAGFSTVVFGPGSITRAHQPNEYVEVGELAQGVDFMRKIARKLSG